ncbi:MAG TPA: DUF3050 domain-containing protein [Acidimicrobiales bacterium]
MSRYHATGIHPNTMTLRTAIAPERDAVLGHDLYARLSNAAAVRTFMELHVYAVWDFMSLLKALQARLTSVATPWQPTGDPGVRRLINEIVLVEESDVLASGRCLSHFELYLDAMKQAGARTDGIERFIADVGTAGVIRALAGDGVPEAARRFVSWTWSVVHHSPVHVQAAVFAFGREDLIPSMFEQVEALDHRDGSFGLFLDYLERHIEVDADEHTPAALRMLSVLCGEDPRRWAECTEAVRKSLVQRRRLWDDVSAALDAAAPAAA